MPSTAKKSKHHRITSPSQWVRRYSHLIPIDGNILDLACGGGRHAAMLLDLGYSVTAVDKMTDVLETRVGGRENLKVIQADLETETNPFSEKGVLGGQQFDGIVVVNYLYRPFLLSMIGTLKPDGVLIYETFARGNERYARPRNPDHLLRSGELLTLVENNLQVISYEHGLVEDGELTGVKQRIVAVNNLDLSAREDKEPTPYPLRPSEGS